MDKNQKILLIFIGLCMILVLGVVAFNVFMPKPEIKPDDVEVSKRSTVEQELPSDKPEIKTKEYVNIYFIGKNEHNEEVYKFFGKKDSETYPYKVFGIVFFIDLFTARRGTPAARHRHAAEFSFSAFGKRGKRLFRRQKTGRRRGA